MINEILLRRKNLLTLDVLPVSEENTDRILCAMMENIKVLGFVFSQEVFELLRGATRDALTEVYTELLPILKEKKGADVEYTPMYKGFPEEVAEASEAELFVNAILHYWTFGLWMPETEEKDRLPLYETTESEVLGLGKDEDVIEIARNLLSAKTSLSEQDKEDVLAIVRSYGLKACLPEAIPMKETLAFITDASIKGNMDEKTVLCAYYSTATDVLRLAVSMSDGDVSLAAKTKFKHFSRVERRFLMDMLAGVSYPLEDMFRYRSEWLRLGEILHPYEFKAKEYDSVKKSFYILRNGKKPLFFMGKVETLIAEGKMKEAADQLKKRPGMFVRALDKLLRGADDDKERACILNIFDEIASKVSVPVLLQTMKFYENRNDGQPVRVFFPKGSIAKVRAITNELPELPADVCDKASEICRKGIRAQLSEKESMGKVYISEELKNYVFPFSQRSAASGEKIIIRGSRLPINENANTILAFVHWTNLPDGDEFDEYDGGRVDIDLSCAAYDENWNLVRHISYMNLWKEDVRNNGLIHSGDITDGGPAGGKGVAEFIFADIAKVSEYARYLVFQVFCFTVDSFKNVSTVRFGWMEREDAESGETFEPSTVKNVFALTADSRAEIPVIFDVKTREFIWCDMQLARLLRDACGHVNNLEDNVTGTTATCFALANMRKPTVYDVIRLNAEARGEVTEDRNRADIIFDTNTELPLKIETTKAEDGTEKHEIVPNLDVKIVPPYEVDYLMGAFL